MARTGSHCWAPSGCCPRTRATGGTDSRDIASARASVKTAVTRRRFDSGPIEKSDAGVERQWQNSPSVQDRTPWGDGSSHR